MSGGPIVCSVWDGSGTIWSKIVVRSLKSIQVDLQTVRFCLGPLSSGHIQGPHDEKEKIQVTIISIGRWAILKCWLDRVGMGWPQ